MLGCPNIPHGTTTDEDGQASVASRSDQADMGSLFLAHHDHGAYFTKLWDPSAPLQRIHVKDGSDFSNARYMESFESRHSDQSFTAQVAKEVGVTAPPLRMDSQVKYGECAPPPSSC